MGNGCSRGGVYEQRGMPSEVLLSAADLRIRFCNQKEDMARRVIVGAKQSDPPKKYLFFGNARTGAPCSTSCSSSLNKWIHYEVVVLGVGVGKVLDDQIFLLRSGRKMQIKAIDAISPPPLVIPLLKYKATSSTK